MDVSCGHTHCIFNVASYIISDWAEIDQKDLEIVCFCRRRLGRVEAIAKHLYIVQPSAQRQGFLSIAYIPRQYFWSDSSIVFPLHSDDLIFIMVRYRPKLLLPMIYLRRYLLELRVRSAHSRYFIWITEAYSKWPQVKT